MELNGQEIIKICNVKLGEGANTMVGSYTFGNKNIRAKCSVPKGALKIVISLDLLKDDMSEEEIDTYLEQWKLVNVRPNSTKD